MIEVLDITEAIEAIAATDRNAKGYFAKNVSWSESLVAEA
jgi:hypothetical protein